jgi:hypothetical protein
VVKALVGLVPSRDLLPEQGGRLEAGAESRGQVLGDIQPDVETDQVGAAAPSGAGSLVLGARAASPPRSGRCSPNEPRSRPRRSSARIRACMTVISGQPILNWIEYQAEAGGYDVTIERDKVAWEDPGSGLRCHGGPVARSWGSAAFRESARFIQ